MASKEVWDGLFSALDSLTEAEFEQTLEDSGFNNLPLALSIPLNLKVTFADLFPTNAPVAVSKRYNIPEPKNKKLMAWSGPSVVVFASDKSSEAA